MKNNDIVRCDWAGNNPVMINYHDNEWGEPVYDDRKLFEFLMLDAFQAGLSWAIILNKRENFRKAFDNFDPEKIVKYDDNKIAELIENKGIIRNKLKISSMITNSRSYLDIMDQNGSFSDFLWQFTEGRIIAGKYNCWKEIPATSKESDDMSKALKKAGFKFVGSTICYAFMQAVGMVNDHTMQCFRYEQLIEENKEKVIFR